MPCEHRGAEPLASFRPPGWPEARRDKKATEDRDVPDIADLELCIELINSAKTPEEAFSFFCHILARCGYDRVVYSLLTDHPSLGLPRLHGLASSYPDDWMKYYIEHDYLSIDPVVHEVLKLRKPAFWDDIVATSHMTKASWAVIHGGAEAGLHSGMAFPMAGLAGEISGIAIARSDAIQEKKDYDILARAYLLGTYFHETYRDMFLQKHVQAPELTAREHDVLLWAAEGKGDQEIAIILGISFHTVRFHWRQIFRKLDVTGRSYAITKAIRLGLVTPEIVRTPYQHW